MTTSDIATAHRLADAAGEVIRSFFRGSWDEKEKEDYSVVTEADQAAESAMRSILESVAPRDAMFDLSLASEEMVISPPTVVSPLNITLKASDLFDESVPFPITKAVFDVLNEVALLVTEEPEELYCPITKEA